MQVKFGGNPVTLIEKELKVGDAVPEFTLTNADLKPVTLADTSGVRIFLSVPSLDTKVCDIEVARFNEAVSNLPNLKLFAVSLDLPFAQSRWCANKGTKNVVALSDFKDRSFGYNFGVYIKEIGLLTRAAFVVDSSNSITYVEYVSEVTNEPEYDKILEAAKAAR